jgi:anti-sigma regulatory factor (Ser/Thr protein kinase)
MLTRFDVVPEYVFSALPIVAPLSRAIVARHLVDTNASTDQQFGMLVAVGEAVANAVEHAYRGVTPGLVRLTIDRDDKQFIVTVEDYGRWRKFVEAEERGRGIKLMHALIDGVQIRSTRESTKIVLKLLFSDQAEAS